MDVTVAERGEAVRLRAFALVRTRLVAERLLAAAVLKDVREEFSRRVTRALAERADPATSLGPRMTRVGV